MRLILTLITVYTIGVIYPLFGESFPVPEVIDEPLDISSYMEMCRFKISEAVPENPERIKKIWQKVGGAGVSLGYSDDILMFRFKLTNRGILQGLFFLNSIFQHWMKLFFICRTGKVDLYESSMVT